MLFDRLVKHGVPFGVDQRYVRSDGSVVWSSNSVSLVHDKGGVAQHVIAVVIDITGRKHAEERDRLLAAVSAELTDLTDRTSTLQRVTAAIVPAAADWCAVDMIDGDGGYKRVASSNVDPSLTALSHSAYRGGAADAGAGRGARRPELISHVMAPVAGDGPVDDRLLALREFGLRSFIAVPLFSREAFVGTLAMGTSSSGRSYQSSDLVMATELGRRVSIAIENANLYFTIRQAARRKDEFLATLAHELRNPLAPLRNSLQIMRVVADKDESVEQALGIMERQIAQLRRLVDDLLDVSRIDTGKIELRRQPVLLATVVNDALEAVRDSIEASHELTVALPPHDIFLYADPARIAQVITNLLDNAAKYTPPGGRIALTAETSGDEIVIAVNDTGIGIAADQLEKIFDIFVQLDNSIERPYGGLGIGLTLVKRLIEMHGGRISAHSDGAGQGSSFVLRLRMATDRDEAFAAPMPGMVVNTTIGKQRIIVVDDNRDSASSFGALLKLMGHDVHIVNDGREALQALADYRPEIMFLDIGMPGMNGYEVVRHIRNDERNKNMLVVALTGYGTTQDVRCSKQAGFDMHIIKPIDIGELNQILSEAKGR
jgi:signal transduction histidine kinase/ActR/RegA family two-component response regulator